MNDRTMKGLFLGLAALAALAAAFAYGQRRPGQGVPKYDPASEATVRGTIEEVTQVARPSGWGGTHMGLKMEAESLDLHLGPSWFLEKRDLTFSKGVRVQDTGSRVKYDDADALIAREIKKGDKTLTLRDALGIPVWSLWRQP